MIITKDLSLIRDYPRLKIRGCLEGIKFPAFLELKLDGEFEWIILDDGEMYTVNHFGTKRTGVKELTEIKLHLPSHIDNIVMLGELFYQDGRNGDLYHLLENKNSDTKLNLKIHDVYSINNKVVNEALIERKEFLHQNIPNQFLFQSWVVDNEKEANMQFTYAVCNGYEGIILKNFQSRGFGNVDWFKRKSVDESDLSVFGIDPVKDKIMIGYSNGNRIITTGLKVPAAVKKNMGIGDVVKVRHHGILKRGLRDPVYVEIVSRKGVNDATNGIQRATNSNPQSIAPAQSSSPIMANPESSSKGTGRKP